MWIAKNNDLIILANNSRAELEKQLQFMVYTDIEETETEYTFYNGEYLTNAEFLKYAKIDKIAYNDKLRDEALFGGVMYQNVLFDSDTDQKVNLMGKGYSMSDDETIVWYGMDNKGLLCHKSDIMAIGELITELHSFCWQNNAYIKEQIENAETLEELEQIEINYDRNDS